jgi:geranylgeranyl pyrophosphate synthase
MAAAVGVEALLAEEAMRVDDALAAVLAESLGRPAGTLDAVIRYATLWGGKRLRPVLCVRVYRALAGPAPDPIYEVAAALELVHAYSLMHDDLPCMDDDDTRRGRPSTHLAFGAPHALLGGAALIPIAGATALRGATRLGLEGEAATSIVAALARAAGAGGMVGGQMLDLRAEGAAAGLADLERVHALKTGALLSAATEIGALAARASAEVVTACAAFGAHLGLAFQIADDVLEASSDAAVLGKPVDGDARLAKATMPSRLGLDAARDLARKEAGLARVSLAAAGIEDAALDALADYAAGRDR